MDFGRVSRVFLGVTVTSAVVGALAGVASVAGLVLILDGARSLMRYPELYGFGAAVGAACGVVLGPLAGFGFLRRVPLGHLFGQTAAATIVGGVTGLLLPIGFPAAVVIAAGGFLAAGVRLAWVHRPVASETPSPLLRAHG